jgi:hypothetical protein
MPTATILIADGDWSYIEKFSDDELYVYTSGSTTWFILTSARMGFTFPLTSVPSGAVIQNVSFRFSVQSNFSAPGAEVKIYNGTYAGNYPDVEDWDSFDTELATVDTFTVATHTIPLSPLPTTSGGAVKLMLVPTTSETFFSIYARPGNDNLKAALIVEYEEPEPGLEGEFTAGLGDAVASFSGHVPATGGLIATAGDCTASMQGEVETIESPPEENDGETGMTTKLVDTIRAARLQVLKDAIDASEDPPGYMVFYSGPIPEDADDALDVTNLALGKAEFSYPCGTIDNEVLTFGPITPDGNALATGEATFVRIYNGNDDPIMDMTVTDLDGNGSVRMTTTMFVEGAPFSVPSGKITAGGA